MIFPHLDRDRLGQDLCHRPGQDLAGFRSTVQERAPTLRVPCRRRLPDGAKASGLIGFPQPFYQGVISAPLHGDVESRVDLEVSVIDGVGAVFLFYGLSNIFDEVGGEVPCSGE